MPIVKELWTGNRLSDERDNNEERFVCGCVWFQYSLALHHMHRKLDLATSKSITEIY